MTKEQKIFAILYYTFFTKGAPQPGLCFIVYFHRKNSHFYSMKIHNRYPRTQENVLYSYNQYYNFNMIRLTQIVYLFTLSFLSFANRNISLFKQETRTKK